MSRPVLRFRDDDEKEFPPWEKRNIGFYLKEKNIKETESAKAPLMAFVAKLGVVPKGERFDRSALIKTVNKQYKRTDYGDFIYSSNNLDVGAIGLNLYGSAVISPVYEVFSSRNNGNLSCLSLLIQQPKSLHKILEYRQGVTYGQYRIHPQDFLSVSLDFPMIKEQNKIGEFVSVYDDMVDYQSKRLQALQRRKLGLLQGIFSQTIRFRDSDGREFPPWEEKRLGDIAQFIKGLSFSKQEVSQNNASTLVIRSSNIRANYVIDYASDVQYVVKQPNPEQLLQKGDVVVCLANGSDRLVGKSAYYNGKYTGNITVGAFCGILRSNHPICKYLIQTTQYKNEVYKLKQGGNGALANLYGKDILGLRFLVPSLEEQRRIAEFLGWGDREIELEAQRLETMKTIKKGLLQQMFI